MNEGLLTDRGVPDRLRGHPTGTERVIGRYVLGGELAAGGMATVHIGRLEAELGFSRVVAIKHLHPQYARDPDFVSMLLDEARLACRIRHANVVPVLDVVIDESELFLVMEYVAGESLASLLRGVPRVPPNIAVALAAGILEGLEAAHRACDEDGQPLCIVHRDVSPQNVLVGIDGMPRLLDFGIAKAVGRTQTTRNNELKGKLAYMAPEQLARAEVDARADVFAASIVLWEMLTGRRLFATGDEVTTCVRVATLEIPPAGALVPVPAGLDAVLMRGLSREAATRWQSARAMSSALQELAVAASAGEVAAWLGALETPTLNRGRQLIESCTPARSRRAGSNDVRSGVLASDHPLVRIVQRAQAAEAPTRIVAEPAPAVSQAPPRRAKRLGVALAVAALTFAGLWASTQPERSVTRATPLAEAAAVAPSPPPVAEPVVELDEPILATTTPSEPTAKPAAPRTHVRSRRTDRPRAVRSRAADDCAVPFLLDETGVRIPKRHCL
jgi:serine/threonine protein kinase